MRSLASAFCRVLAIDPTTRGIAFAVMEGPENLIDWGVKSIRPAREDRCLACVAMQIGFFAPTVVVMENPCASGSRRCARVRHLIESIRALAADAGVRTRLIAPREIKAAFVSTGAATKHEIAVTIADQLPELANRVPRFRKPWMSEDYRMNIFDAAALVLTWFILREKRHLASSRDSS